MEKSLTLPGGFQIVASCNSQLQTWWGFHPWPHLMKSTNQCMNNVWNTFSLMVRPLLSFVAANQFDHCKWLPKHLVALGHLTTMRSPQFKTWLHVRFLLFLTPKMGRSGISPCGRRSWLRTQWCISIAVPFVVQLWATLKTALKLDSMPSLIYHAWVLYYFP